jgi:hypothetical protein
MGMAHSWLAEKAAVVIQERAGSIPVSGTKKQGLAPQRRKSLSRSQVEPMSCYFDLSVL